MPRRLLLFIFLVSSLLLAQRPVNQDDRIYDEVRKRLAGDAGVRGGALEVDVKQGVVTLRGPVREEKQKLKAEKVAKKVKGVTRVVNEIEVKPSAP